MPIYEFIPFIILISCFMGGFLYCLIKETKSNCDLRKRMIQHMDNIESLLDQR